MKKKFVICLFLICVVSLVGAFQSDSSNYKTDTIISSGGEDTSSTNYKTDTIFGTITGAITSGSYKQSIGFFYGAGSNYMPTTPTPEINSTDGTNTTASDLNCFDVITDPESGKLNVTVRWYNNDVLKLTIDFNESYSSGASFNSVLADGNTSFGDVWKCSLRLFDGAEYSAWGNSSDLTIIDTTNPDVTIGKNDSQVEFNSESININWTATDEDTLDTIIFNVTFPNKTILYSSSSSSGEIDLSPSDLIVLGTYEINLWANDTAGNSNSTSDSFFVNDTIAPSIEIISPLNQSYSSLNITFNVSLNEEGSWCGYSLDDAGNLTMTKLNATYFWEQNNSMTPGSHRVVFTCNDTNNNFNSTEINFSISDDAAISIEFSSALSQIVNWTLDSLPATNLPANGNNDDWVTGYHVNISATNTLVDLYVRADGNLETVSADILGLGNETYSFNITDNTLVNSSNHTMTTSYFLIGESLDDGDVVYLKFYLSAPSAQPAGTYSNNLEFKAVRENQAV